MTQYQDEAGYAVDLSEALRPLVEALEKLPHRWDPTS